MGHRTTPFGNLQKMVGLMASKNLSIFAVSNPKKA